MSKIIQIKKVKLFWLYFIVGALAIIAAIFLTPFWANVWKDCPWKDWGAQVLGIIIAAAIVFYIAYFLIKKTIHSRGTIQVLYIVEIILLLLIAAGSVLAQFKIIPIDQICTIVGLIFWCEGSIDLFRAYFHQRDSQNQYPLWRLCIAIAVVTFGACMFAAPFFENIVVLYIFAGSLFIAGVLAIVYGVLAKPIRNHISEVQ